MAVDRRGGVSRTGTPLLLPPPPLLLPPPPPPLMPIPPTVFLPLPAEAALLLFFDDAASEPDSEPPVERNTGAALAMPAVIPINFIRTASRDGADWRGWSIFSPSFSPWSVVVTFLLLLLLIFSISPSVTSSPALSLSRSRKLTIRTYNSELETGRTVEKELCIPGGGAMATMFRERREGSRRVIDAPRRAPASSMDVGGGYRMSSSVGSVGSVGDAFLVLPALLALPPLPSVADEGVDGGGGILD
mmetsp:Transcript_27098/g.59276  ORF Transcript_27098/g.59276 Transcript_27098/m.59276 type:complete len:246 (+) Transcript_27098:1766-2503(+)